MKSRRRNFFFCLFHFCILTRLFFCVCVCAAAAVALVSWVASLSCLFYDLFKVNRMGKLFSLCTVYVGYTIHFIFVIAVFCACWQIHAIIGWGFERKWMSEWVSLCDVMSVCVCVWSESVHVSFWNLLLRICSYVWPHLLAVSVYLFRVFDDDFYVALALNSECSHSVWFDFIISVWKINFSVSVGINKSHIPHTHAHSYKIHFSSVSIQQIGACVFVLTSHIAQCTHMYAVILKWILLWLRWRCAVIWHRQRRNKFVKISWLQWVGPITESRIDCSIQLA